MRHFVLNVTSRLLRFYLPLGAAFFFAIQATTGILLMFYYEPSARPAVTQAAEPIVLLEITKTMFDEKLQTAYTQGNIIPVPYNTLQGRPILPFDSLRFASLVITDISGKPLFPSLAYLSVEYTLIGVPFGALVGGIHRYAAHGLIATALVWILVSLATASYQQFGIKIWAAIVLGTLFMLASGWTGSVLPWNVRSYLGAEITLSTLEQSFPFVGMLVAAIVRGAPVVAPETLTRVFALHVVLLPLVLMGLTFSVCSVQKTTFFRRIQRRIYINSILAVLALLALVACATLISNAGITAAERLPADLSKIQVAPEGVRPEWYFAAAYRLFSLIPAYWAAALVVLVVCYVFVVPFFDHAKNTLASRIYASVNGVLVFLFLGLTLWK